MTPDAWLAYFAAQAARELALALMAVFEAFPESEVLTDAAAICD
jgi:hypothetical protein